MTDQIAIALTFVFFLLLFTVVGIYSAKEKQTTTTDYLLANRNVNPWLRHFRQWLRDRVVYCLQDR